MIQLAHLAQTVFNRPLAIRPEKAELIVAGLAPRLGVARLRLPDGRVRALGAGDAFATVADELPRDDAGYGVIDGVAVIEVHGTLVQRQMGLRPLSGMTGYNAVRRNFFGAIEDPGVRAIALDIDSPGGDCAGLFDLTDAIFAARGTKPIWAILDETAASAAYAIAAAADHVTVPRTGHAGSIGIIVLHCDLSRMLDKEGVTVTILQYGARKAEGQPALPLSAPARDALQADINAVGELFVASAARYRKLAPAQVRRQEAAVFMGAAAVAAGLADAVMSPAEAFAALAATARPPSGMPPLPGSSAPAAPLRHRRRKRMSSFRRAITAGEEEHRADRIEDSCRAAFAEAQTVARRFLEPSTENGWDAAMAQASAADAPPAPPRRSRHGQRGSVAAGWDAAMAGARDQPEK